MLKFTCPYCQVEADETELTPGGEAHLKRMGPGSSDQEFYNYLFERKNFRHSFRKMVAFIWLW